MNRTNRSRAITEHVMKAGSASVSELAVQLGVSTMTVHRDLAVLEQQSVIRRYRGGASALPSSVFESNIGFRMATMRDEKAAIAVLAFSLVEPGMSVMLDEGSTALAVAQRLTQIAPLTVVTHFLGAITVLKEHRDLRVVGIGGVYSHSHDAFLGLQCIESVADLRTDILFLSTSAVSDGTAFHQEQEVVEVKRAMMNSASKRILLVDSSKFGKTALHRFSPLSAFDLLITDWRVPEEVLDDLKAQGLNFQVAAPLETGRGSRGKDQLEDRTSVPGASRSAQASGHETAGSP